MFLEFHDNPDDALCQRIFERRQGDDEGVRSAVEEITSAVRKGGDEALTSYMRRFDGYDGGPLYVTQEEFDEAGDLVPRSLKDAIELAYGNIWRFHEAQRPVLERVETMKGVSCWRIARPLSRVGLYVPGGTAPLFSTVLMLAIPAKVAGCGSITLSTPARKGKVDPTVLYCAKRCGVDRVLKAGGAQAIAAMAYGTGSVLKVDKIFGPGNRYVAFAKSLVSSDCAIDMMAGPSEVMVVCDKTSDPAFIASDLLSQAEHGPDSQVMLLILADDGVEAAGINAAVEAELDKQLSKLGRQEYMLPSLSHSASMAVRDRTRLVELINAYAPEHLILSLEDADSLVDGVTSAGSIFLGPWSPESVGDYASGTNHTLPTAGWARSSGGLSLDSFIKKITVQKLTKEGLEGLGPAVMAMAEAEDLMAHRNAVEVRLS